jgi:hypothetical protein
LSTKKFTVVFIADSGRVTKTLDAASRGKAVTDAIASLKPHDIEDLGIDAEGRTLDVKHWPVDEAGFPTGTAQTEGLKLRTVTTVERVTGNAADA